MKTKIEKQFSVAEPIEKVWAFLSDPSEVVVCVPGASVTEKIDDKNFKGQVSMKFGPVKTQYSGEIEIQELDPVDKKMVMYGKGLDSKGKGSAEMAMIGNLSEAEGETQVAFTMDVSITGKLAQFGARLVNDVTDQIFKQFIENFKEELSGIEDHDGEKENTLNAGSLMGAVVKERISGIFKGKKKGEEEEGDQEEASA